MARGKWVLKDGEWQEGKASPELLREDLRRLPSELITKDIEDNDKIHELDPEHTNREIVRKYHAEQAGLPAAAPEPGSVEERKEENARLAQLLDTPDYRKRPPIVQYLVDIERMRCIRTLMANCIHLLKNGASEELATSFIKLPRHLWYPEDTVAIVELREGKWAPRNSLLPKRLQGIDLNVDMLHWPERIMDKLAEAGFHWKQPDQMLAEMQAFVKAEAQAEADLDALDAQGA